MEIWAIWIAPSIFIFYNIKICTISSRLYVKVFLVQFGWRNDFQRSYWNMREKSSLFIWIECSLNRIIHGENSHWREFSISENLFTINCESYNSIVNSFLRFSSSQTRLSSYSSCYFRRGRFEKKLKISPLSSWRDN